MDIIISTTQQINDAMGRTYGYEATVDDGSGNQIPNPVTPDQFTQSCIETFLTDAVRGDTYRQAQLATQKQVDTDLEATPIAVQTSLQSDATMTTQAIK